MPYSKITLRNIRVYSELVLEPAPRANLIVGPNACGKSSILEALNFLATGRSFRAVDINEICRHGADWFEIRGTVEQPDGVSDVGIRVVGRKREFTLNGDPGVRLSDVAAQCPSIFLSPESHYSFKAKSADRRAVLDWFLFHVKPEFRDLWSRYQRILAQRNLTLQSAPAGRSADSWTSALIETGNELSELRRQGFVDLELNFKARISKLLPDIGEIQIGLDPGWPIDQTFDATLHEDRHRDRSLGTTSRGPHRASIFFSVNGQSNRSAMSQGQAKLAYIGLRLAQAAALSEATGRAPNILLDDVSSELDQDAAARVMTEINSLDCQVFVTTTEAEATWAQNLSGCGVFHVKQERKNL